ncbi:MAG: acyl carrier protein [Candidatus Thermoplasmatota archaeon]|jgi:acyl carrier protein|nr:acyl carrier protein [Candidatus Thermoplasmatota archaeon]MDP7264839.1 acyl carrier protein [Candidatus Thermoplasmatota archaeon]
MNVIDKIKPILVNELALDESEITSEANLMDDLGADSINLLMIYSEIGKIFDVKIDDKMRLKIKTVGDMIKIAEGKGDEIGI